MSEKMHLSCWGGVGAVTGANFLLECASVRLLVDCGLLQGVPEAGAENENNFPYDPKTIDFLFITHAHMDHIGKVPKLVKDGFRGTIYSTPETRELAEIMLADALKIMNQNARMHIGGEDVGGEVAAPLYGNEDLHEALNLWKTINYHTEFPLRDGLSVYLLDAGHILGSSMYEFRYKGKKVFFTGDSGNSPTPLLRDTEKIVGADYLLMDSVYGDRNHESKEERDARFATIVRETIENKGALVIPAFSMERTQVILYELNNLIEGGKVPSVPVFLDSPLGSKVTAIYERHVADFNAGIQKEIKSGDDIFDFPKLRVTQGHMESEDIIKTPNPKIIIAGSGMSSGGRVMSHEMHFLPDPKSTILLMGYQALGTLGRRIQDKPSEVEIDGSLVPVNARIEMISGYSSHKDSDHLVDMVADTKETVKKVFVVMGEPKSSQYLVQRLHNELGVNALYPERGVVYDLEV